MRKNLIGRRFGRLTVLSYAGPDKNRNAKWLCRCECGTEAVVRGFQMESGRAASCGCLMREKNGALLKARATRHGHDRRGQRTPEYRAWVNMRRRCEDPKHISFKWYGGRGIKVCERWQTYENFFADVGSRPPGMTLDRYPDNDGDYGPANFRWATPKQQANNRRAPCAS